MKKSWNLCRNLGPKLVIIRVKERALWIIDISGTNPLRFEGSKGLWEEHFLETTPFFNESSLGYCFLGFVKRKRMASAEAKAPKIVAVETRVSSRVFIWRRIILWVLLISRENFQLGAEMIEKVAGKLYWLLRLKKERTVREYRKLAGKWPRGSLCLVWSSNGPS